jgi:hypothetical protein
MAERRETRWVIVNDTGLYTGQWLTRADAIAQHVSDLALASEPRISPYTADGKLTPKQRTAWRRHRARGDRAVRATISYPARMVGLP